MMLLMQSGGISVQDLKELGPTMFVWAAIVLGCFYAIPVVWTTLFGKEDGIIRAWISSRESFVTAEMDRRDKFIQAQIAFTEKLSENFEKAAEERREMSNSMALELSAMRAELKAMREELMLLRQMFMQNESALSEMERLLADSLEAIIEKRTNYGT